MEGTYRKRYYPRNRAYGRNKKSNKKENFALNVVRQTFICIIIFLLILGLKSVDASMNNYMSKQIAWMLSYTTDLGSAYQNISAFSQKMSTMLKGTAIPTINTNGDQSAVTGGEDKSAKPDAAAATTDNVQPQATPGDQQVQGAATTQASDGGKDFPALNQPIVAPLQGVVTSKFGMRIHPIEQKEKFHYGIDIDGKKGADIIAAMEGEVSETGVNDTYGKYIRLQHKDGFFTFYGHCSEVIVKKGQKIKMKEVIGNVGDTGAALGVHLHFEIWKDNKALDPLHYVQLSIDSNS